MNTLDLIIKHGIAVRQIPLIVIETWSKGYTTNRENSKSYPVVVNGREFVRVERIPENAGCWMSQVCKGTSANMLWDTKRDNLALTLEDSVSLLVAELEAV